MRKNKSRPFNLIENSIQAREVPLGGMFAQIALDIRKGLDVGNGTKPDMYIIPEWAAQRLISEGHSLPCRILGIEVRSQNG